MKKILVFLCFLLILLHSDIIHSKVIPPKPKPNEYIDKSNQNTKKSKVDTNKDFNTKIKKLNKEFVKEKSKKEVNKDKFKKENKVKTEKKIKEKKITKERQDLIISKTNNLFPEKKPDDLGLLSKKSVILSEKDFLIAQRIFNNIKRKRWDTANKLVKKSKSKELKLLVQWMYLKERVNKASFYDYVNFINFNKEWPRINRLRYLAEHKIDFKKVKSNDVIDFFKNKEPFSGFGKLKLGEAYLIKGEKSKGEKLIIEGFKTAKLNRDDLRYLNKKYKYILNSKNYIDRAQYLAWGQDYWELKRTIRYLPAGYKELYFARFALMTRSYGVDAAIAKVPQKFINDIGLKYDRAKWRRKRGRHLSALDIINTLPKNTNELVKPDLWFKEKFIIARRMINKKQFEDAYQLFINHGVEDSSLLAEAEWHAGWLSLRFLNDPNASVKHFKTMFDNVNYPISKSRAAYWLGNSYETLGTKEKARSWYSKASKFNTTFYGQLAATKLNKKNFKVKNDFQLDVEEYKKFKKTKLARVAILLEELDRSEYSKDILRFLGGEEKSTKEKALAGRLSQELQRLDFAIQIAKESSYKNINLIDLNYPTIEIPKKVKNLKILDDPFILALIRQESEFDSKANSFAGAKGLMQIMPATGKLLSKKVGLGYSRAKLTENDFYNLQLGSFYITNLYNEFNGSIYMALAAYNAGPHRVTRWIRRFGDPRTNKIDPIDWIELIPFSETRNYVQRVIENIQVYKFVLEKKDVSNNIDQLLFN
ncbi:MAG: murein transglycosylase [Candidatus Pelagibacter sp.]|nr:murein transglycosylase [Candidatus Pelagibacter sp.]OUW11759.1 MAG: murein transglycosylase [Candidatus Pelagibacter sp. TMED166]|tara:strand:- start:44799 stop:47084 length:2286 start_codon:yes stop_codon:yes gene_type:complete